MVEKIIARFPDKQSIVNVFATAAFIVYGWTIYASFWKIPSWIFYLNLNEIFSIYAYSFITNFVESALLTLGLVFLGFFLSGNFWKDGFLAAGIVVLFVSVGSALWHMWLYEDPNLRVSFVNSQFRWWMMTALIALVASSACVRHPWLRRILENLADRFAVFLYIYIPLTILSLGIVIIRMTL